MKSRLKQAGLWCDERYDQEIDISLAWNLLARIGLPGRYGGKAPDGSYEFVIIDPETGYYLATGKGRTLELSICEAALNASLLLPDNRKTLSRISKQGRPSGPKGEKYEMPRLPQQSTH